MRRYHTSDRSKLASHLRCLRGAYDMTLAVLAERSGISRATLSRIENAEVSPTAETLGQLAAICTSNVSAFVTARTRFSTDSKAW